MTAWTLLFSLVAQTSANCLVPAAASADFDAYTVCLANQGSFGNRNKALECVKTYKAACLGLADTKYCTITRSTGYAFGTCLPTSCVPGSCTTQFSGCNGTIEALRALVGAMDDADVRGCCDPSTNDNTCNRADGLGPGSVILCG
eukprot:CAMPEP_0205824400 /NCGR_PEP_ID=MMETSP0206-20130828/20795_1 /ASSEMBLY_ACC=CAM_ASM_000279 /TAXON_ID=36767 /ORGANISM="Euplotes focardii, Strain TN1" /LENGTH=144 /DNA_ID=CAMNT_0053122485 /DNA_START=24 /DNA_END=454 /DNA_ORIENTATION=-